MENLPTYRLTQSGPEAQEILDQVNLNTIDIEQLKRLYQALIQSEPEIIEPTDTWPVANPEENVIYRVIDRVNTPPQYYSDYMWNGTSMVLMGQYNNAIDNEPTANSNNLVKSGGVYSFVHANGGAYDISAAHAVGGVLATYDDLADALGTNGANVPAAVRKGGMSIKFVLSSDNKYVRYNYLLSSTTNANFANVANWQGVDEEPEIGSHNLVESGGVAFELRNKPGVYNTDEYAFAFADENGKVAFAVKDGYPVTKNFDGKEAISPILSYSDIYDLDLADENGNVALRINAGHIKTKYFDSQNVKQDALAGLKMVGIGDSIMHGQSMGTRPTKPYMQVIAEYFGMTYKNYGIGGSTFAISPLILGGTSRDCGGVVTSTSQMSDTSKYYIILTGSPSTSGVGNYSGTAYYHDGSSWVTTNIAPRTPLTTRYQLMDDDADLVLVAAGTNDFQYNWTSVGTIDDAKAVSPSADTFYGAVAQICQGLITKYPKKTIVFLTPIKRGQTQQASSDTAAHNGGSYGTQDSENTFGKTLKQYGEIIKEVCGRFSIPVIDMYADCNLTPFVSAQAAYFDSYKTHPDQNGHDIMARYLIGQLKSIFGKNINI